MDSLAKGWLADKTRKETVKLLVEKEIPAKPVNTINEAIMDHQIKGQKIIVYLKHSLIGKKPVSGIVIRLSQAPGSIETPVPNIGRHNKEIYCDLLDYNEKELYHLEEEGVI